jgi:hypothetical protein
MSGVVIAYLQRYSRPRLLSKVRPPRQKTIKDEIYSKAGYTRAPNLVKQSACIRLLNLFDDTDSGPQVLRRRRWGGERCPVFEHV